ncbi:MAG: transporter substrate-binding domain-containing protein [Motiliproteus sp.]
MRLFLVLPFFLWLLTTSAAASEITRVSFCADDAQWPPFSYRNTDGAMDGFTVALLKQAFARLPIEVKIEQLPWKRCMAATDSGRNFQVAIDASASPQRQQTYLLSLPYYQLSPYFFYSRKQFPDGIDIKHGHELTDFGTVCGLAGYNYSNFGLDSSEIDQSARDFYAVSEMTHRGRCGLFIGRYEIVAGMVRIGPDLLADPELAYAPIPDAQSEPFHMLISRHSEQPEQLKQLLDNIIQSMEKSGELEQIRLEYGIPPTPLTGSSGL